MEFRRGAPQGAGGQVGPCEAHGSRISISGLSPQVDRQHPERPIGIHRLLLDESPRRNHPDHVPVHDSRGLSGVLNLFANGDRVAGPHQADQVALHGLHRDPGHGNILFLVSGGEGEAKLIRRHLRVLEEHLVEIPHPKKDERTQREFFANYYLGLYKQANGKLELADELIGKALEIAKSTEGYIGDSPGGQLRAGDIARVHSQQLQLQLADQRAWMEEQKPRSNLGAKLAYVGAGIGLVVMIGLGLGAQRRKRRKLSKEPAVEANLGDEPAEEGTELAGKSST